MKIQNNTIVFSEYNGFKKEYTSIVLEANKNKYIKVKLIDSGHELRLNFNKEYDRYESYFLGTLLFSDFNVIKNFYTKFQPINSQQITKITKSKSGYPKRYQNA